MSELDLRASDADRDRKVDELRAHAAEGRLTLEELEERVQRALAAQRLGELRGLAADLPDPAPPAPPARSRPHRPELRAFVAAMGLLVAIWALTGAGYFWPVWPLIGWGVFALGPSHRLGFPRCHPSALSRR
jgi:fatty acid desaturase